MVWRATDTVLHRDVALKRIRLPEDPDEAEGLRSRVRREARIAARLHHPALVGIFDVLESDGEPWLVLEYVPSQDLTAVVQDRGPLAPAEVARIGVALAGALAVVHAAGIVHRDLKPANVLLGRGTVKLTDFGISRMAGDLTLTASGALVGTPAYLPPEVALGEEATAASDVFGLGATLYTAVEGTSPYGDTGGNLLVALRAAAEGRVRAPQRAGPLGPVLRRLLDPDPVRRPDAVGAAALLRRVAAGPGHPGAAAGSAPPAPGTLALSPVPGTPGPPPGGPRAAGRRRRWPALLGAGVAALVVALVVVLLPRGPAPPGSGPTGAASPAASGAVACDTSRGTLVVGLVSPLSGDLGDLGLGMRNSAELAVRQADARCAVPGYSLRLQAEDDQDDPEVAAQAAARLAADPAVIGVVGGLSSSASQAVAPVLAAEGIVQIAPASTSAELSRGPDPVAAPARPHETFFRLSGTDRLQGPFAARYAVQDLGLGTVAVVDDGTIYGGGLADGFAREAQDLGARVGDRRRVGEQDTDFSDVVAAAVADGAEAVFFGGEPGVAGRLSAQLGASAPGVPLIGGDPLLEPDYLEAGGRVGDLAVALEVPPDMLGSADRFLADYAAAGFVEAGDLFGPAAFDSTTVLIAAAARVTANGPWAGSARPAVAQAVQDTRTVGAVGPIAFDGFGDLVDPALALHEVRDDGWWVTVVGS